MRVTLSSPPALSLSLSNFHENRADVFSMGKHGLKLKQSSVAASATVGLFLALRRASFQLNRAPLSTTATRVLQNAFPNVRSNSDDDSRFAGISNLVYNWRIRAFVNRTDRFSPGRNYRMDRPSVHSGSWYRWSRHERRYNTWTLSGSRGLSIVRTASPESARRTTRGAKCTELPYSNWILSPYLSSKTRINARYSPIKISRERGPRVVQSPTKSRLLSSRGAQFAEHRRQREEALIPLLVFDFAPAAVYLHTLWSISLSFSLSLLHLLDTKRAESPPSREDSWCHRASEPAVN